MGAALHPFWLLWAVHIPDGSLRPPWLAFGFVVAGALVLLGSYKVRDEEIPRIALLSAAFFVASLMHLPLGPASVHLLLNGLVGVVLGMRAPLAILIGLGLQAVLFGHGGITTLGVNTCVQSFPALLAAWLFALLRRLPSLGRRNSPALWVSAFLLGNVSVLATLVLEALVLLWGGAANWRSLVQLLFLAHLPIAVLEGVVLAFTVSFLVRVKPEILGLSVRRTSPSIPQQAEQSMADTPAAFLLAALALLLTANSVYAHRLDAGYIVLPGRLVRIESWFDLGGVPKGAVVQVHRPDRSLLAEGKLDENGCFTFRYSEAESLEVHVAAADGHSKSFVIPREELLPASESPQGIALPNTKELSRPFRVIDAGAVWRERLKDALLGVNFLLSLAAFLLSWRTSRRLRRRHDGP